MLFEGPSRHCFCHQRRFEAAIKVSLTSVPFNSLSVAFLNHHLPITYTIRKQIMMSWRIGYLLAFIFISRLPFITYCAVFAYLIDGVRSLFCLLLCGGCYTSVACL